MKYHPYKQTDPFKAPELADKVLNEYLDIAEAMNIDTCLIAGTCLGFVRDGGYIEGDNDIDVIIMGTIDELKEELVRSGFDLKLVGMENSHFIKHNIFLDVFYDYLFPQVEFIQDFDFVEYKGRTYNIPHPVEDYLTEFYGDWKTIKHREVWENKDE